MGILKVATTVILPSGRGVGWAVWKNVVPNGFTSGTVVRCGSVIVLEPSTLPLGATELESRLRGHFRPH